jgi:hypothetical protein
MAISEQEWNSVRSVVEAVVRDLIGGRQSYFMTAPVIKRDTTNRLIWVKDLGDQPVPVVGFNYTVKYYDSDDNGTHPRTAVAKPDVPKIGETVFIAFELGLQWLPRCLGVLQGNNWMVD